ncbi:DRTGG domain-containing protein [Acetohalobium arabaticum]|uniref:DRTGG domain protein n=1 Tax=Acetohalobium arabaticum (strain ATCC 49924 / DSM 5501 / Z-7288) TaxID=574087 RepID=D9QV14_ACEAZ|nr:DRTGG domain-containing protein [Acetohalobium arabaticum]ADL12073.1 DRTGG domain protein [Acetohalobium arabaticum DSM 5501]
MKLKDIKEAIDAEIVYGDTKLDLDIVTACGADLMSDVLTFTEENTLLLTGLTKPQVIRTADMLNLAAIVFVRGKNPNKETIKLAQKNNIALLSTDYSLYKACGLLYRAGLAEEEIKEEV